jgi:WXG100 family type VII secretion target
VSAPIIQVNYEDLSQIAKRFEAQGHQMDILRQRLARKVEDLQHSGWQGQGQRAFSQEMHEDVLPAVERLKLALEASSGLTLKIIQIFQNAEDESLSQSSVLEGNAEPPPRVYIVNGINCKEPRGTPGAFQLKFKENMVRLGYPEDQIVALGAIYNTDYKFINYPMGIVQVQQEYVLGENGKYTRQVYEEIMDNLNPIHNPLAPGQKIVLVGHSGGGAVMSNVVSMLEERGHPVEFVATLGSPVVNQDNINAYSHHLDIRADGDLFGLPFLRSDEAQSILTIPPVTPELLLTTIGLDYLARDQNITQISSGGGITLPTKAHASYIEESVVSEQVMRIFQEYSPTMKFNTLSAI